MQPTVPIRIVKRDAGAALPAAPSAEVLLTTATQQVVTLLAQHQQAVADLVSKVSVPAPTPVIIQREAPPPADGESEEFAALREILLLHQLQLEALVEALKRANEEAQQARSDLMAVVRKKGRIADIEVSYDAQGQITKVTPVYQPL